ncbi:MAG TPA: hypothetical protein VND66_02615 [Acidobacteriaceae bacterium]|nr:hypothetical protein [Acidobacteriaceae bacterium]
MKALSRTRRAVAAVLLLAIAATAWLMMQEAVRSVVAASHNDVAFNPGYQHSQRLKVAAARAAMDVLGTTGAGKDGAAAAASYEADYRLQRTQIQADSEGLERWAAHDSHRQGLLLEIRASVAELKVALDQAAGSAASSAGQVQVPLMPALNRAESAFSNYAASLSEPMQIQTTHYMFAAPVLVWWLLILVWIELAALAWLMFSAECLG